MGRKIVQILEKGDIQNVTMTRYHFCVSTHYSYLVNNNGMFSFLNTMLSVCGPIPIVSTVAIVTT